MTCHNESGERRNGSSAGRSGEHLTDSGDLTIQLGAHPTASGKCEKLYNHPNRWGGILLIRVFFARNDTTTTTTTSSSSSVV